MASIWQELKGRSVVRVGVAYAVVAWLLVQVIVSVEAPLNLPSWTDTLVIVLLGIGFFVALILAWAFELTPQGVKRTKSIPLADRAANVSGRKLDFVVIGLLALALGFVMIDQYVRDKPNDAISRDLRSIAALPFDNESAEAENAEFFANGIHDELLTQLAKIRSLKVISRTSVEEYRDTTKNMRDIGRELGVATLLEGRVQRAGNMVRINVQLIDAEADEHLWAETYNRELTAENIFAIQSEMATSIADALQATLTPREAAQLDVIPTESTRAWDFYLSGNEYIPRRNTDETGPLAIRQFERAVEEDPGFAQAWAALSLTHSKMYLHTGRSVVAHADAARQAVERAIELAPNAPESHLAMARFHYVITLDYEAALEELSIAEQGMPGTVEIFMTRAGIERRANDWESAAVNMERAARLDPRNVNTLGQLSDTYLHLRNYAEAERVNTRRLEIAPDNQNASMKQAMIPAYRNGDFTNFRATLIAQRAMTFSEYNSWLLALYERDYNLALRYLNDWNVEISDMNLWYVPIESFVGVTHALAGQRDAAIPHFDVARNRVETALENSPDDARMLVTLGEALLGLGQRTEAIRAASRAIELMPRSRDALVGSWIQQTAITRILAPAGINDVLLEQLDDYLSQNGWWSIEGLLPDPRFDLVRDDPRFLEIVEKHRRK